MMQGCLRLRQESQRDPAGEKFGFDIRIARDEAVLVGDLVSDASVPGIESGSAVEASLDPPIVEIKQHVRLARCIEQHLPGFFVAILAAEPLDAGESKKLFQAFFVASLRANHWMRFEAKPNLGIDGPAGSASRSLPALPPLWTT